MKKRWEPDTGDIYYLIDDYGNINRHLKRTVYLDNPYNDFLGIYRTKAEAEKMHSKIRRLVKKENGEVE